MTAEREIGGFAFPFAAAIAASIYLGTSPDDIIFITSVLLCTCVTILSLLHPKHRKVGSNAAQVLIAVLAVCTGLICAFTESAISQCTETSAGFPHSTAGDICERVRTEILKIPFADHNCNAIISALITGNRTDLSEDIVKAFRDSGASHVLALSGLHLGIIYGILRWILKPLGNSRPAKTAGSICMIILCGLYTLATGASASIVRAFIFILTGEAASLSMRHRNTRITLMTALIIQTALTPGDIRTVGFQLSYMAMAGIAYIYPWMKSLWPEGKEFPILRKIWNSLSMSISCQLATAPLAYMYFQTFPVHFMLTNLITLPLIGIIIPASLATLMLSWSGFCPEILIKTTEALIMSMTRALEIISVM